MIDRDFLWHRVKRRSFWADPVQGSALVMCLVFMSALSTIALSALESAWSGQRMISAYVSHQQTFMRLETELRQREHLLWQEIRSSGLEPVISTAQEFEQSDVTTTISFHGTWIQSEFSQQCGPLFDVVVSPGNDPGGSLRLTAHWDVCCNNSERCMASDFRQLRRLWSRATDSPAMEL